MYLPMTDNYVVKLNFRNVCSVLLCYMLKANIRIHYSHCCTKTTAAALLLRRHQNSVIKSIYKPEVNHLFYVIRYMFGFCEL
jgi:hypothetical protein